MANAASPKEIQEQERRRRTDAEIAAADLRFVMSDTRGRRFISKLLDFCGPLRSAFNTNGSVANFNMGQQNVGLKLFADLEDACPDLYMVMKSESRRKED